MDERQPEALMRRIHEEMVQADLFEIAMILSTRQQMNFNHEVSA